MEGADIVCRFDGVDVLAGADIVVEPGELVVLLGPSGSGKSTLLNVLCGFARPDQGTVRFDGEEVDPAGLGWRSMALLPQALGLLEELTAAENIALPGRLAGRVFRGAGPGSGGDADALLTELDLAPLVERLPAQLSLGERQRVAVARAYALGPRVVLADEPTSHQDAARTASVLAVMRRHCLVGSACLVATHDEQVIAAADRVLKLSEGRISDG